MAGRSFIDTNVLVYAEASDEQLATLMALTERYCVILQTLRQPPSISASLQRVVG